MSEPFLALFTNSEVFLSLLEGLVLRPLLFDVPRSTIQTERLNNWTVSKLFLQRLQMEEVYMASLILLIVLAVYCIWSASAYGEAAQRKSLEMCGLSLSGYWNVPIKATFCPSRRTLFPNGRI